MSEHARLGCSNPRWRFCPGSVREEAVYPDIPSAPAQDGTGTHLLLEMALKAGVRAEQYVGQTIGLGHADSPGKMGWFVDVDRAKRVQICLDYIVTRVNALKQLHPECHVGVAAEMRVFPGRGYDRDDWWGTCDVSIFATSNGNRTCHAYETVDYKDGRQYVSEKNNTQLLDYILGGISRFNDEENCSFADQVNLFTTIVQPKITDRPVRTATTTVDDVFNHGAAMYEAAKRTDDPDAPLIPGKHCHYCKHKQNCNAQSESRVAKGAVMESNLVEKVETQLQTMANEELAKILDAKEVIMGAIAKAEAEAKARIEAGQLIPGWIMGEGNSKNVWNASEEEIEKKLGNMKVKKEDRFVTKLISPAQARQLESLTEKQKKNLESMIATVAGKPTLKKGKAVERDANEMFAGVDSTPVEQSNNAITYDFM